MIRRWLVVALTAVAFVALTGCTADHDGYFANPCDHELTVIIDESIEAQLAPLTVTKVESAFNDAGDTWDIEVEGFEPYEVTKDDIPKWTVALPAAVCGE